MKQLKVDGWEIVAIRGSHRQLKHPAKRGRVTVARTLKSIRRQAGWED